jgi:hypothetical protein
MKYAVEMGSGAVIYIPSFIKICSGIQKLMGEGIHRQHGDCISLLSSFQTKESTLIRQSIKSSKENITTENSQRYYKICSIFLPIRSIATAINPLEPSGYYTYHLLQHTKTLHSAHTVYLCVPYNSHNKQRLFPQTALTGWAL